MKNSVQLMSIGAMLAALTAHGGSLTREQIDAMLLKIAQTPPAKTSYSPGATCYLMGPKPRPEYEYICTKCGTHSFHAEVGGHVRRRVGLCIAAAAEFREKGLDVEVDNSAFCRTCNPGEYDNHGSGLNAVWVMKIGEKSRRIAVQTSDVELLRAFLDKEEPVDLNEFGKRPIQEYMGRLCELLDVQNADELKALAGKLSPRFDGEK